MNSETKIYRNKDLHDNESLSETCFPDKYTINECWNETVKKYNDKICMRYRSVINFQFNSPKNDIIIPELGNETELSYRDVDIISDEIAINLQKLANLKSGDKLGIYHNTHAKWMLMMLGCVKLGVTVSTCYANLGYDALKSIINECELTTIFTEEEMIPILDKLKEECPTLKYIIYSGKYIESSLYILIPFNTLSNIDENTISTDSCFITDDKMSDTNISYDEIITNLDNNLVIDDEENIQDSIYKPEKSTIAVIMYTSGSTGNPKGVMVSHSNVIAASSAIGTDFKIKRDDVYLGYLPLAHILELMAEFFMLWNGICICYGSVKTLKDDNVVNCLGDFNHYQPTLLAGVPKIFNMIEAGIKEKVNNSGLVKRLLFNYAFIKKNEAIKNNRSTPFWDWLIFDKIKEKVGGKLRIIVSGGAPLNPDTQEFIRTVFGCKMLQGYGLTEVCGCSNITPVNELRTGIVGPVVRSIEMKLIDVPEMNYYANDNQGEVLFRGPSVTQGYYNNPEKTNEVYVDGWFHTGDIGCITSDGSLIIIDRKKNIMKLANGEYVALDHLSSLYMNSPFVSSNQICIYGRSDKNELIAIIVLHESYTKQYMKFNGELSKLIKLHKNELKDIILDSLNQIAVKNNLVRIEKIKDVILDYEEWTPENEMLTAAMKLNRGNIVKKYQEEINIIYNL
jgi:long-chain acyl-CoA synthetase